MDAILSLLGAEKVQSIRVPSHLIIYSKKQQILEKLRSSVDFPTSYTSHTSKEEAVLEYVEDFRRQFVQVFPHRRPLMLCPLNETNIHKFVCTSIKPTLLPYQELHNLQACVNFVQDFFDYLPLDEPTRLPDMLMSPSTLLKTRAGDCFDLATFLCSLLRGAGYDAFVVSGYAPKHLCQQDLTQLDCPLLDNSVNLDGTEDKWWGFDKYTVATKEAMEKAGGFKSTKKKVATKDKEKAKKTEEAKDDDAAGDEDRDKYETNRVPMLTSKFIEKLEFERIEMARKRQEADDTEREAQVVKKTDPLGANRIHAWVLVMAGRRQVQHNVFVEVTTGKILPVASAEYVGIESMWNETNYWVNVQKCNMKQMQYDLKDTGCWEYVLFEEQKHEDKLGGGGTAMFSAGGGEGSQSGAKEADDKEDILDCPPSWCDRVVIDRAVYRDRYPSRRKLTQYRRCTVEKFSDFYDGYQGLSYQITLFADDACEQPIEVRSVFKNREDKLLRRMFYPMEERTHEYYDHGRAGGLREFITVSNKQRLFKFDPSARVDGMVGRQETLGVKVMEIYQNRDDFLIYRAVSVESAVGGRNTRNVLTGAKHTIVLGRGAELPIRKITEKYSRDSGKHAENDVMKCTHFLSEGLIRLDFHFNKNMVDHSVHLIDKEDKNEPRLVRAPVTDDEQQAPTSRSYEYRVDPMWKPPSPGQRKDELTKLLTKERELITRVKANEEEIQALVTKLEEEKMHTSLVKSFYDIAQEASLAGEQETKKSATEKLDKSTADYLTPFLGNYVPGKPLKGRQAQTARDLCLAAFKERVLERANVIQAHLDHENQKMHQQQTIFKRQAGNDSADKDVQQISQAYHDSIYRIEILKERVRQHEADAVEKFLALEQKLNDDPRLEILRQAE